MELAELENILNAYDRKVTESNRLNRNMLRKLLAAKSEKHLNKEKIKAGFYILSPFILFLIVLFTNIPFNSTSNFYIGLAIFIPTYLFVYVWDVKYYIMLCGVDFTDRILSIKKRIALLEKYKVRITRIRYALMPVIIIGILLMLLPKFPLTTEFVVMLALIFFVFLGSLYYTRYSVRERYHQLNKEIEEIEGLEE